MILRSSALPIWREREVIDAGMDGVEGKLAEAFQPLTDALLSDTSKNNEADKSPLSEGNATTELPGFEGNTETAPSLEGNTNTKLIRKKRGQMEFTITGVITRRVPQLERRKRELKQKEVEENPERRRLKPVGERDDKDFAYVVRSRGYHQWIQKVKKSDSSTKRKRARKVKYTTIRVARRQGKTRTTLWTS